MLFELQQIYFKNIYTINISLEALIDLGHISSISNKMTRKFALISNELRNGQRRRPKESRMQIK